MIPQRTHYHPKGDVYWQIAGRAVETLIPLPNLLVALIKDENLDLRNLAFFYLNPSLDEDPNKIWAHLLQRMDVSGSYIKNWWQIFADGINAIENGSLKDTEAFWDVNFTLPNRFLEGMPGDDYLRRSEAAGTLIKITPPLGGDQETALNEFMLTLHRCYAMYAAKDQTRILQ